MSGETNGLLIPDEVIMNKIYYIRGQKVMLDSDLAELYGVETHIDTTSQKYRKIVRFRQLMAYKLQSVQQSSYTTLSHKANYTDQSHFIKTCKQITGFAPSQFFREGKIVGSEDTFWKFSR